MNRDLLDEIIIFILLIVFILSSIYWIEKTNNNIMNMNCTTAYCYEDM